MYLDRTAGVADPANDTGDHGADSSGIIGQQPLQDFTHAIDNTVLDLEFVLSGTEAHLSRVSHSRRRHARKIPFVVE
jgi:hypothetical protein